VSEIRSIAPLLPANDVRAAVEWYQAKLGLGCLFVYPPEHPDYAGVAREGAEIHFFRMKIDPARSDWMCYLRVTGIEELFERSDGDSFRPAWPAIRRTMRPRKLSPVAPERKTGPKNKRLARLKPSQPGLH
jgi:hypothetical protein